MDIQVKGRNVAVSDETRARLERRLEKVARQVSPLARVEFELWEERNPSVAAKDVAEATLHLKGVTLRARECTPDMQRSLTLVVEELARQVKRHRDKRRRRREQRAAAAAAPALQQPLP